MFTIPLMLLQLTATIVMTVYFFLAVKDRQKARGGKTDFSAKARQLSRLRGISLTRPLTERLRPSTPSDIIGQSRGMRLLINALCGENPQHVIIYGPPGVGKTAAARVAAELAKHSEGTPFKEDAPFIEADATVMQYDERAIADPLLGSVHDPIYQGAGAYGNMGIPQPRAGAVTKAHGGILFLDEIGELNGYHLNRLLKVLEEGKVRFYSSYYSETNSDIPKYIHDIFKNGMPADFRLIGATTRQPEELPSALRSRCREIFFDDLTKEDGALIAKNSLKSLGALFDEGVPAFIGSFCLNGRDSVNAVQDAVSLVKAEGREIITIDDVKRILNEGGYQKRQDTVLSCDYKIGVVNALAVCGSSGRVLRVEAAAFRGGTGVDVRGAAESEEVKGCSSSLKKKGSAVESAENVLEVLERLTGFRRSEYHISINFPQSHMADGPSAGAAMLAAVYSAVFNVPLRGDIAFTGELGLRGEILPVGGVAKKAEAAQRAGASAVYIPFANKDDTLCPYAVPVSNAAELLDMLCRDGADAKVC